MTPRVPSDLFGVRDAEAAHQQPGRRRAARSLVARLLRFGDRDSDPRTLRLALECRACRRTHRYEVETLYLDPEQVGADPIIGDRIQCRGCGRWDDYSLTSEAHEAILVEAFRVVNRSMSPGPAPQSPIALVSSGLQDGRRMSPENALRDYEGRLVDHPGDPGLHLGHGNVLRFLKRFAPAETSYRRALELDPDAAEAHASLAQVAAERGDFLEAARGMERCARAIPRRHFYRLPADARDAFCEEVREDLVEFRRRAGLGGGPADSPSVEPGRAPAPPPAVGRNAPCPCGSGKKFKKCCLVGEPSGLPPVRPTPGVGSSADEELKDYLAGLAVRAPHRERERAIALFSEACSGSQDTTTDTIAFFDWFIHDYRLGTSGRTLVEETLLERPADLSPAARTLLESWRDVPPRLYEVIAVEPGVGMTLRDLLGSAVHRIREVRGSRCVARWDVVAARLISIDGEKRISATVLVFRPEEKPRLLEEVERRFREWRQGRPSAELEQFLKADGLLFHRLAGEIAEHRREEAKHLMAMTAEGHTIVVAKARYKLRDASRVLAALRSSEDFEAPEAQRDRQTSFIWLKRGASARLVARREGAAHGFELTGYFHATPDAEPVVTLGDVRLRGSRLFLECLSRERLAWGKTRLADLLGDAAMFEVERFESLETKRAAAPGHSPAAERRHKGASSSRSGRRWPQFGDERGQDIAARHLRDHYVRWMDTPLPALGGTSPRQASRDPRSCEALEVLLRQLENLEDHRRMTGGAFCDVSWMRPELGM